MISVALYDRTSHFHSSVCEKIKPTCCRLTVEKSLCIVTWQVTLTNVAVEDGHWSWKLMAARYDKDKSKDPGLFRLLYYAHCIWPNWRTFSLLRIEGGCQKVGVVQLLVKILRTYLLSLQRTFHYDSDFWKNKNEFNLPGGETGFDSQETKLPTYWETPFSKICLGMKQVRRHQQAGRLSVLTDRWRPTPRHLAEPWKMEVADWSRGFPAGTLQYGRLQCCRH